MIQIKLPDYKYMFERWEFANYRKDILRVMHDRGIYVFFDENGSALYVGKSTRIRSRIQSHINGIGESHRFSDLIKRVGVIEVEMMPDLDIYESYAINLLKPQYNLDKVFYRKDDFDITEFEYTVAADEVERLRDTLEFLNGEDVCTLQQVDLQLASEEYRVARLNKARLSRLLDVSRLHNGAVSIITS